MKKTSHLKRTRLLAHMTQTSVAGELGISQSTYQRWEAGTLQIPEKKVTQISKLFGTSKAAILGTPQPFDLFGIDKSIGDDRTYYGEVAIHFKSGGTPLLLPITEAVHGDLFSSLQQEYPFVKLESLDTIVRLSSTPMPWTTFAYQHTGFGKAKLKKLRPNSKMRKYHFHGCTHGLKSYSIVMGAWSENFSPL